MEDFIEIFFRGIVYLFRGMFGFEGKTAVLWCWLTFLTLCGIGYVVVIHLMKEADVRSQFKRDCEERGYVVLVDKDNQQQCVETITLQ